MIQFWRVLHAGGRNFLRNMWLSTAATAVMTITLTIIVISFISNSALTQTIKGVTNKIDISIYLNQNTTTDQAMALKSALEANENVQSVTYKSKDEVVADYKKKHANDPTLIEGLNITGNPLDAEIHVTARDPKKFGEIVDLVNSPQFKPLLDPDPKAAPSYSGSNKVTIDRIVKVSNFFKTAELMASLLFIVISILIIFNTIRMAIFTRREEIEIMKLVGATKWFIRGPFIFEAALYGIVAAIIAVLLSYLLLLGGGPKMAAYINVQSTIDFFRAYPALVILGELIIGVLIGAFSSMLAMTRYLKL
jgi:cell division transport system permease protein